MLCSDLFAGVCAIAGICLFSSVMLNGNRFKICVDAGACFRGDQPLIPTTLQLGQLLRALSHVRCFFLLFFPGYFLFFLICAFFGATNDILASQQVEGPTPTTRKSQASGRGPLFRAAAPFPLLLVVRQVVVETPRPRQLLSEAKFYNRTCIGQRAFMLNPDTNLQNTNRTS